MLELNKVQTGTKLTVKLSGRLDTTTVAEYQAEMNDALEGISELVLDMDGLQYISSAGLRVILASSKKMGAQGGGFRIINAAQNILEIFEVTGIDSILTIN